MNTIWMCFSSKGIPNEIIIKILYQNKGLAHPLSIQIDKGLGWYWSDTLKQFDKLESWQKSYMLQMRKQRHVIINQYNATPNNSKKIHICILGYVQMPKVILICTKSLGSFQVTME